MVRSLTADTTEVNRTQQDDPYAVKVTFW